MKKYFWQFMVVGVLCLFLWLAYKEPPFVRSLIPNLEPYPDTLFYAMPAWNFVKGQGFRMMAFGREIRSIVPPLYGLLMVPFFGIFADVRAFWGLNLLLLLGTIFLFLKLAKEIFKSVWVAGFLGLLLATNFYFYTLPSLLMAENLSMFLTMIGFYLLFTKKDLWVVVVAVVLLLTKLSNLPLTGLLLLVSSGRLLKERDKKVGKFLIICFGLFLMAGIYFWQTGMLVGHKNLETGTGFGLSYFGKNFKYYWGVILGEKVGFLWFRQMWIEKIVFYLLIAGTVVGLAKEKERKMVFLNWGFILAVVSFMSFFYAVDARYLMPILPMCLLLSGPILKIFDKKKLFYGLFLLVYLLIGNKAGELKRQVGLNLRHREDPWNYLALKNWEEQLAGNENAVLATFLPPFYVSMVLGEHFEYLPISPTQEFSVGEDSYFLKEMMGNLKDEYRKKLEEGKRIYISDYYVSNNLSRWREDYEDLVVNFKIKKVNDGCLGACNLYELEMI